MNEGCSRTGFLWVLDTYSNTVGPSKLLMRQGLSTWFLVVSDYAYGHQMQTDLTRSVTAAGGKVVGSVLHPIGTADFSSYLLQAQASGAQVVGLLNSGSDLINCVKQAAEFGITQQQKFFLPRRGDQRHPLAGPRTGPRPVAHEWVLLGPQRREPDVVTRFL